MPAIIRLSGRARANYGADFRIVGQTHELWGKSELWGKAYDDGFAPKPAPAHKPLAPAHKPLGGGRVSIPGQIEWLYREGRQTA